MPRIYALLVGINAYKAVEPLHGCVADINAVEALLDKRITTKDTLVTKVLRDGEATRAAIIDGFTTHLAQAGAEDIALFYFCGHGSEEESPEEWKAFATGGKNQTLVPVDARVGDVFDIADKELSALIHAVAEKGAQVVTFFDSCHSGGVTRSVGDEHGDAAPRMTASAGRKRTLADYTDAARALYDPARDTAPEPSHIAIAACQFDELAKEFPKLPPRRGAFTQAFEEAVNALGPTATYADLTTVIRTRVLSRAKDQVPNITAVGSANPATLFMAGTTGRTDLTLDSADGTWWLSAGAIEGIPAPDSGDITTLAIYPRGAFGTGEPTVPAVAEGTVDAVEAQRSRVVLTKVLQALDPAQQYVCTITAIGRAPMHLLVTGDDAARVATVRGALAARAGHYTMVETKSGTVPTITVRVTGDTIQVLGTDDAPLQNLSMTLSGDEPAIRSSLSSLSLACMHMARWFGTRDRTPVSSSLNGAIVVEVLPAAPGETVIPADRPAMVPGPDGIVLSYANGQPPQAQFRVRNTANVKLYVVLLDLTDSFGCSVAFEGWVMPGEVLPAYSGRIVPVSIPSWRDPSWTVAVDIWKVFAAKTPFDGVKLKLASLLNPKTGAFRDVEEVVQEDASFWGTSMLRMETRR